MGVKKGQELELEVADIAFGGRGLAKVDGFAVFIDQAVPRDYVRVRVFRKKRNFAEARVVDLLRPSPHRVDAPCRYSGYCGGCKWQFLDYEKQLEYKRRHVSESLEHIGLIRGTPVHPTLPSEKIFGYRNKMEFSFSDRRWLMPEELGREDIGFGFALGLHVPGTFHKVLDTAACLLQPDLGNKILEDVRKYVKKSDRPVYGLKSHEGFWRFLMLRHSAARDEWMVNLITAEADSSAVQPLADTLMKTYPNIVSVVNNITARKAGVAVGEYEIRLGGASTLTDRIGRYDFEISANSFFQTNTRGAEKLYEIVTAYAELTGTETVLDLYCGTGAIAITLSEFARKIIGLELVESAVADAAENCLRNGVDNCRFLAGDIRDRLVHIEEMPEVMIIDPPRAGMHVDVVNGVLEKAPRRIVYVSCNPATLARDLSILKDRYHVLEVQPVDMFPHTFHIESVAKLERI